MCVFDGMGKSSADEECANGVTRQMHVTRYSDRQRPCPERGESCLGARSVADGIGKVVRRLFNYPSSVADDVRVGET